MDIQLGSISREANDYVAGWIRRQPTVKEESITDWLLDFFHQKTPNIRYYEFNRFEEARFSGADWDWWFLLRNGCYKIRVQAKKIRRGKDHFLELARSNQTGYQIDLLIESSSRYNFYPLYVLYGNTEGVERCPKHSKCTVLSICSAQEVYKLLFGTKRHRVDSRDVLSLSIPLECLFTCPLVCNFSINGPEILFQHYFNSSREGKEKNSKRIDTDARQGYDVSVPNIIRLLYQMGEINDNTERILREYQSMFSGSKRVSIVRIQDDENEKIESFFGL